MASQKLYEVKRKAFPKSVQELKEVEIPEILKILLERACYTGPTGREGAQGIQGPRGEKGDKGDKGEQGDIGPIPAHEWDGSRLRFQRPDKAWGEWVDLEGPQGLSPEYQWNGTKLRFKNPDGKWGEWVGLQGKDGRDGKDGLSGKDGKDGKPGKQGPRGEKGTPGKDGKEGKQGKTGPIPKHEIKGKKIRFEKPDGKWGEWIDLEARQIIHFPLGNGGTVTPPDPGGGSSWGLSDLPIPCEVSVYIGAAVILDGGVAKLALADTLTNSFVRGIVEEKPTPTTCLIRYIGVTGTLFSGLDTDKQYFLSAVTPGEISVDVPVGSGEFIVPVGTAFDSTRFVVSIGNRMQRA